jgi:hypothetical protein
MDRMIVLLYGFWTYFPPPPGGTWMPLLDLEDQKKWNYAYRIDRRRI